MTIGLVHGELTTLLWGGAFAFLWGYTAAARLAVGRHPKVRHSGGRIETLGRGQVRFRTPALPPAPAFFSWTLVVAGVHSSARSFLRRLPLTGLETDLPAPPERGRYTVTAWWEMTDLFGFTRLVPRSRWETVLTVEVQPLPFLPPQPPATRPGPWRPRRAGRRAGDPFDVRHYIPGDDLRRLHWPLYAHSGVPFVRTAEPTPPPTGHQFLILDTEAGSEEELDDRLGRLVTWLADLEAQGTGWTLAVPAAGQVLTADPGPLLASLSPAPLPDGPVDAGWPDLVTLLTGPRSVGAARLVKRLSATRRRFRPVVVPPPPRTEQAPRPWWRRP